MTVDELETEALKLPVQSRAELVQRLSLSLDDLEMPDPEHDRLWREEVERRYRDIKEGNADLIPAEEALAAIRAELQ